MVVHLPGKQEVVGWNPTGRADFFLSVVPFPLFLFPLAYTLITILSVHEVHEIRSET